MGIDIEEERKEKRKALKEGKKMFLLNCIFCFTQQPSLKSIQIN